MVHKFNPNYLDTEFLKKLQNKRSALQEEHNNIYFGKIFNDKFLKLVMDKIKNYELNEKEFPFKTANSMHRNAISVSELGLNKFLSDFVNNYFFKFAKLLYPERVKKNRFDGIHSYIVRYGDGYDHYLDFHVDDSLVTLNLCLNEGFLGAELNFKGERCPIHIDTPSLKNEEFNINHEKGFVVIHDGKNRHYVNNIIEGKRYNLIIWCQDEDEKINWYNSLKTKTCLDFCNYTRYF